MCGRTPLAIGAALVLGLVVPAVAQAQSQVSPGLKGRVEVLEKAVASLQTTVAGLKKTVIDQGTDITKLQTSVAGLKTTVANQGSKITNLQTTVAGLKTTVVSQGATIKSLQTAVANQQTLVNTLQETVEGMDGRVAAVENSEAMQLNQYLEVGVDEQQGRPRILFTGVNIQLVNGLGPIVEFDWFNIPVNGLGNLVLGYDESDPHEEEPKTAPALTVSSWDHTMHMVPTVLLWRGPTIE